MQPAQPTRLQRQFWNEWNTRTRERSLDEVSLAQANVVERWIGKVGDRRLEIIDVGCGTGWLSAQLVAHGSVTGIDLADEVIERAKQRVPSASFIAGDFLELDLGRACYDLVVCLEVLSHVPDQVRFIERIAQLLRPNGYLILATQNRRVLKRNRIVAPAPGQLRRWVDQHELVALLEPEFDVIDLISVTPRFNRGVLRIINSATLDRWVVRAHLGLLSRQLERFEERMFLGWTLMAFCQPRSSAPRAAE